MDNNNTELSNKEIGLITSDFVKVSDQLKNTCNKIIEKKFSDFPVIIMSKDEIKLGTCLLYTSPSPRDLYRSRMPSSA